MTTNHDLSDESKAQAAVLADQVLQIIAERHGFTASQLADAVKWVERRRLSGEKLKSSAITSVLGLVATALSLALWEGVKELLRRKT